MTTIHDAVKQLIIVAEKDELLDSGYDDTNLYNIYMSEYGNYNGFTQNAVKEYCMGLPHIFSFPIYNSDILEVLNKHGISRKSEKAQDTLIDQYWQAIGSNAYLILKQSKKNKG